MQIATISYVFVAASCVTQTKSLQSHRHAHLYTKQETNKCTCRNELNMFHCKYCKTLIIRVTLFSRGHQPRFIQETLFSWLVIKSSIILTLKIIGEDFIFTKIKVLANEKCFKVIQLYVNNSVFPCHCFSFKSARVISLYGVQLLGFIHLSHVKIAILDIVFWAFNSIFFGVFIENSNNWLL